MTDDDLRERRRHYEALFRRLLAKGLDLDATLRQLRSRGASELTCMIVIRDVCNLSYGQVKHRVLTSEVWKDARRSREEMWQDILRNLMATNILVFSDPHGRIPLLLKLVWGWQEERGISPDVVLVAGDLGVWPDSDRLDSSTRKYSQKDPSELDFQCFEPILPTANNVPGSARQAHTRRVRHLLDAMLTELDTKVVFVGGNHEDYDYLNACKGVLETFARSMAAGEDRIVSCRRILQQWHQTLPANGSQDNATIIAQGSVERLTDLWQKAAKLPSLVPIELSGLIWWLPPGRVCHFSDVQITGISGIDPEGCSRDPGRYHASGIITEDTVIDATLNVLESIDDANIDVLLTHDGLPDAARSGKGTWKLLEALVALNPRYHFFGHYHSQVEPISYAKWLPEAAKWHPQTQDICPAPGVLRTTGVHINKLAFDRHTGHLRQQIMGHLAISESGEATFRFADDPWLEEITDSSQFRLP